MYFKLVCENGIHFLLCNLDYSHAKVQIVSLNPIVTLNRNCFIANRSVPMRIHIQVYQGIIYPKMIDFVRLKISGTELCERLRLLSQATFIRIFIDQFMTKKMQLVSCHCPLLSGFPKLIRGIPAPRQQPLRILGIQRCIRRVGRRLPSPVAILVFSCSVAMVSEVTCVVDIGYRARADRASPKDHFACGPPCLLRWNVALCVSRRFVAWKNDNEILNTVMNTLSEQY